MADESKNVKRIQSGSRAEALAMLPEKMISLLKDDAIAMRNSDGTVDYAPVEDSDATFNSLQAVNLAGIGTRNIGVDENGNVIVASPSVGGVDYTDYNPLATPPSDTEGRFWYDDNEKTMRFFNDNPNFINFVNNAQTIRAINNEGVLITRGTVVDLHEGDGAGSLYAHVADSLEVSNNNDEGWAIAVATEDIAIGAKGAFCFYGGVLNIDTSALTVGAPAYLGSSGSITNTRPNYPEQAVLIGASLVDSATTGVFAVKTTMDNYDYEFDGCIVEKCGYNIVVVDTAVYIDVYNLDSAGVEDTTRNLPIQLGGQVLQLNTTTGSGVGGRARKVLTQGTATAPQYQTVYIKDVGGVATLDVSLTTPPVPYAIVGQIAIRRHQEVTLYGADVNRRITSSKAHNSRGRISYLTERWGVESPKWFSGVTPTASITTNIMDLSVIAGEVYQTHKQSFPALTVNTDGFFIANGGGGAGLDNYTYFASTEGAGFQSITDALGYTSADEARDNSCTGNAVFIGIINKDTSECKIVLNLPSRVKGTNATSGRETYYDTDNDAIFTAPAESRFVAFLICRIPYHWSGGVASFLDPAGATTTSGEHVINLLGTPLGVSGGASGNASAPTPPLIDVLIAGNDGGGEQIKNIADGTADQDAVTVAQMESTESITITFANSWSGATGNCLKDATGKYELTGLISGGTTGVVGTIPVADAPASLLFQPVTTYNGSAFTYATCSVATDGTITLYNYEATYTSLNGVGWRT